MAEQLQSDPYSGNQIRLTDNGHKDDDIISPQAQNPLHVDDNGLPAWWNDVKKKRGIVNGDR